MRPPRRDASWLSGGSQDWWPTDEPKDRLPLSHRRLDADRAARRYRLRCMRHPLCGEEFQEAMWWNGVAPQIPLSARAANLP